MHTKAGYVPWHAVGATYSILLTVVLIPKFEISYRSIHLALEETSPRLTHSRVLANTWPDIIYVPTSCCPYLTQKSFFCPQITPVCSLEKLAECQSLINKLEVIYYSLVPNLANNCGRAYLQSRSFRVYFDKLND